MEQYIVWLVKIAHGDFGTSVFYKKPVIEVVLERFGVTLSLAGLSMIVTLIIAIPLGVLSATRHGSIIDSIVMIFSTIGVSVPIFWLAFLLMIIWDSKENLPTDDNINEPKSSNLTINKCDCKKLLREILKCKECQELIYNQLNEL